MKKPRLAAGAVEIVPPSWEGQMSNEMETRPDGQVLVMPLFRAGAQVASGGIIALRLEYAKTQQEAVAVLARKSSPSHLQLGLTLEQAEQLVRLLEKKIGALRSSASQSVQMN